jgi:RNA polymerase sigma-70 factor (ECF subfamily)
MSDHKDSSTQLQHWLDRMRSGDPQARDALLEHACERLRRLTRKMLHTYTAVHRWEQTDDVLQKALLRLHRALSKVQPETTRGFFQLAAKLIRQELIDLGRHYLGPQGVAAHHSTNVNLAEIRGRLTAISRFHELIESLSPEQQEIVSLLYYQGMSQAEVAAILNVTERTVKRRWREARLILAQQLQEEGSWTEGRLAGERP